MLCTSGGLLLSQGSPTQCPQAAVCWPIPPMVPAKGLSIYPIKNPQCMRDHLLFLLSACLHWFSLFYVEYIHLSTPTFHWMLGLDIHCPILNRGRVQRVFPVGGGWSRFFPPLMEGEAMLTHFSLSAVLGLPFCVMLHLYGATALFQNSNWSPCFQTAGNPWPMGSSQTRHEGHSPLFSSNFMECYHWSWRYIKQSRLFGFARHTLHEPA